MWRSLMMLTWALIYLAGFLAHEALAGHIHSAFLRWLLGVATLSMSFSAGKWLQSRLLKRVDPAGTRRRDLQEAQHGSTQAARSRALREPADPQSHR